MENKKGSAIVWGIVIIFASFLIALFLGLAVYSFNLATTSLAIDVDVGQVNLQNVTNSTMGRINTGIINNADTIGVVMLMGMCVLMIFMGYYFGSKSPKIMLVADIFILALFFVPAIYVSQLYETFINASTPFASTFISVIPKTSKFMLNLPKIIASVGVITMIISYAGIRRDDEPRGGDVNVLGY